MLEDGPLRKHTFLQLVFDCIPFQPTGTVLKVQIERFDWQHLPVLEGQFSNHWTLIQGRHILDDPSKMDYEKQLGNE